MEEGLRARFVALLRQLGAEKGAVVEMGVLGNLGKSAGLQWEGKLLDQLLKQPDVFRLTRTGSRVEISLRRRSAKPEAPLPDPEGWQVVGAKARTVAAAPLPPTPLPLPANGGGANGTKAAKSRGGAANPPVVSPPLPNPRAALAIPLPGPRDGGGAAPRSALVPPMPPASAWGAATGGRGDGGGVQDGGGPRLESVLPPKLAAILWDAGTPLSGPALVGALTSHGLAPPGLTADRLRPLLTARPDLFAVLVPIGQAAAPGGPYAVTLCPPAVAAFAAAAQASSGGPWYQTAISPAPAPSAYIPQATHQQQQQQQQQQQVAPLPPQQPVHQHQLRELAPADAATAAGGGPPSSSQHGWGESSSAAPAGSSSIWGGFGAAPGGGVAGTGGLGGSRFGFALFAQNGGPDGVGPPPAAVWGPLGTPGMGGPAAWGR